MFGLSNLEALEEVAVAVGVEALADLLRLLLQVEGLKQVPGTRLLDQF